MLMKPPVKWHLGRPQIEQHRPRGAASCRTCQGLASEHLLAAIALLSLDLREPFHQQCRAPPDHPQRAGEQLAMRPDGLAARGYAQILQLPSHAPICALDRGAPSPEGEHIPRVLCIEARSKHYVTCPLQTSPHFLMEGARSAAIVGP